MSTSPSPELASLLVTLGDALGVAARPATLGVELGKAVTGARSLFAAAACSCALVQPDGATLKFAAADGVGSEAIVGVELPVGRGIAGWVVMSGQPIVTSEVARDTRFARDIAESTNYIPETIMAAPLVDTDGETIGVLEVLDPHSRGGHTGHDLDSLGFIATQVATTVRLCAVYDALGHTLVRSLADSVSKDDFTVAIAELGDSTEGRDELIGLAQAFHELASSGPQSSALAATMLLDVAAFVRARR